MVEYNNIPKAMDPNGTNIEGHVNLLFSRAEKLADGIEKFAVVLSPILRPSPENYMRKAEVVNEAKPEDAPSVLRARVRDLIGMLDHQIERINSLVEYVDLPK